MIFSLEVRRARKGDCLLLHFGSKTTPGLAIVDGGPSGVYAAHLRPRLIEIKNARRLDNQQPLPVDLLMVSHVDDDHIQGILDLTRELTSSRTAPLVEVMSFWHNSFDDIIGNSAEELTAAMAEQFGAAALSGGLPDDATLDLEGDEDSEVVLASLKVLASIEQGHRLRADAEKLGFPRNPEFDEKLVRAGRKSLEVAEGLRFVVAGPMQAELEALQKKHDEWLKEQKKKKERGASLAAYVDASVPNLSSIVVLARSKKKSMLLTGDARGDRIIAGLEKAGLLRPGKRIHVNVLKVPHHGSAHNVAPDFFERITADHYVFSGDGEYGNPERETVEMLFAARANEPFEIHFTYPLDEIDAARKADWKKEQAKEKKRAAKDKEEGKPDNVKPRKDWSDATQALTAFFRKKKLAPGQKVRIVDGNETPHVIDLLDAFTL